MKSGRSIGIFQIFCALVFWGTSFGQQSKSFKNFEESKSEALSSHKLVFLTFRLDASETINRLTSDGVSPANRFSSDDFSPTGVYYGKITGAPCMDFNPPTGLTLKCVFCSVPYDAEAALRSRYYSEDKTALVFDAFGNELYAEVCKGRAKLIQVLQSLPEDASRYYSLLKSLQEHPDSVSLKLALADLCQIYRCVTASRRYYDEVEKSHLYKGDSAVSDHVHSHMALNAFLNDDYDEAEDLFSDHIKDYPHSAERSMQLFLLTRISVIKKQKDDATRYYEMLQREFPNDQHTVWAKNLLDQYKE